MIEKDSLPVVKGRNSEEIKLSDIVIPVWKGKYLIIFFSIIFSGLVIAYHLSRYSFTSPVKYQVTVNFRFEGVEQGVYPNGSRFSPNDLLSGNVLKRVYDELKLIDEGVDYNDFSTAISVRSGFLGSEALKRTIAEIAGNQKRITIQDYNELVSEYSESIKTHSLQNAILSINNSKLHLGKEMAEATLLKIPESWAEYSIQDLGVMRVFGDLITIDVSSSMGDEPLVMVNKLSDYERLLGSVIDKLLGQPRTQSIVDSKTGLSLNDISYKMQQIAKYQVNTLRTVVTNNISYSTNAGLHESFRSSQLDKLIRERGELERLIKVYNEIAKQFDQMSTHRAIEGDEKKRSDVDLSDKQRSAIYSIQYSGGMVNNLLALGSKMADPEFRKQLLNEKIALAVKLQKVETEIEIFTNSSSASVDGKYIPKEEMIKYIKKAANDMNEMRAAIANIVTQFNGYANENTGSLFFISGKIIVKEGYSLIDPKFKIKIIAGFLVGGLLAVSLIFFRKIV